MGEFISLESFDGWVKVSLRNPPVNALSGSVLRELEAVWLELSEQTDLGAVVLASEGERAFAAGADVSEFKRLLESESREELEVHVDQSGRCFDSLSRMPCPVIAAVQADAVGGGWELAMACDVVVAEEQARFGFPEIHLGTMPGGRGTQVLPRLVGRWRAKELLWTGRLVSAREALDLGLVSRVVPKGTSGLEADRLAAELSNRSSTAVRSIKAAVDRGLSLSFEEGIVLERRLFLETISTEDAKILVSRFVRKSRAKQA